MVTFRSVMLIASLAAVSISTPSFASSFVNLKSWHVRHNDLDLSTEKGQQSLAKRVKIAVDKVCAGPMPYTMKEKTDLAKCERNAMAQAQSKAEIAIARYQNGKRLANRETAIVGN